MCINKFSYFYIFHTLHLNLYIIIAPQQATFKHEYLESDLIGMKAFYNDNTLGVIEEVVNNNGYKLLLLSNGKYIPYHQEFINLTSRSH